MSRLVQIWKNKALILEGIKNNVFKQEDVEGVKDFRLGICEGCEHYGNECAVPGTGPCCGSCGCTLAIKTRSLSASCPEGFWDAILNDQEENSLKASLNTK